MAMNGDVSELLRAGIEAAKRGDKPAAADLLQQVVDVDERNEQAWLWLSGVVEDPEDTRICLENVLEINPNNARAVAGLRWLEQQQGVRPSPVATNIPTAAQAPPAASNQQQTNTADTSSSAPTFDSAQTASPFAQAAAAAQFASPAHEDDASPFGPTSTPASPFGQQPPASPFGQQPPASPFAAPLTPSAPPASNAAQYLPFGQAAPPPREVAPPTPPPPPVLPPPEPEANPFAARRRTPSGGLASRLSSSPPSGGDDLNSLRSTLFGGGPAAPDASPAPRPDTPSSFGSAPVSSPFATPGSANPSASPSEATAVGPFATAPGVVSAPANDNANPFAPSQPSTNPFAAPDGSNPFASPPSSNGAVPPAAPSPFAPPPTANGNPFGISSNLRPFNADDLQGTPDGTQNGASYPAPGSDDGADQFPGVNPFDPPVETRPPLFAPRPAPPAEPPRPRGLIGRAGLNDLMNNNGSTPAPFAPPPDDEPARASSPMLISRPPIPGGTRPATADVATFPCPNCRKLVPENALSCPQCSFQFYARCPNCGEYVDTTVPSSSRGDHCPSCGIHINLMELGRAGSADSAPTESGSVRPRSTAAPGEGMTLLMPVKGLVEPTRKSRPSAGRLVYVIFVILIFVAIIVFLLWAKDNLKFTPASANSSATPASVLNDVARTNHDLIVASQRLDAAVGQLGDAASLSAIIAAQQSLSDDRARLALALARADSNLAAATAGQPLWYSQYLDKARSYLALSHASLISYQQALQWAGPLWAFLKLYYATNPASFDLSSLGQTQAVANSDNPGGLIDQWQARQQQADRLSQAARAAAAAANCPLLNDLAAELDNISQLDRLHAAILDDALNQDTVAAQHDTAAVQTLVAEMKAQSFYHPSLLEADTLAAALKDWYTAQVASIYADVAANVNQGGQLYIAAQRQLASRLADDPSRPTVGEPAITAAQSAPNITYPSQPGDY